MKTVSLDELIDELKAVRTDAQGSDPADITEHGSDEPSIDVRLQVYEDGRWTTHSGSSDYDPDHRGYWGASCVSPDDTDELLCATAHEMIDQAAENSSQDNNNEELTSALELALIRCDQIDADEGDGRLVYGPLLPPLPCAAWPGGYTVLYFLDGQHGGTFCPTCATKIRDYGDGFEHGDNRLIGSQYEEGPPQDCDECSATLRSSYGDPDCLVCDGEVSGLTNAGELWRCPHCSDPDYPVLWWMRDNIANAGF